MRPSNLLIVRTRTAKLLPAVLLLGGCSHIATIKQHEPAYAQSGRAELAQVDNEISAAQKLKHSEPLKALGNYLAAADDAARTLRQQPQNPQALQSYNYAVGRTIELVEKQNLEPWHQPVTVTGSKGNYLLRGAIGSGPDRDPANYEIIPADTITPGGTFFKERVTREGLGAPVVAVGHAQSQDSKKDFAQRRIYGTATGLIRFDGRKATIYFVESLAQDRVTLDGHNYPLAADFTAPVAVGMVRERPEKLGLVRLLVPGHYAETARVTRLQAYDPNKIPVIFVHGLQDTPASWSPMLNLFRGDDQIRRRYQFWVYSYPSGYPYPYSAAIFRSELDGIERAFPNHRRIVLIGHSMGGLVCRLMITDSGDKLWRSYFSTSPSETKLTPAARELLEKSLIFNHRTDVSRVIFLSTPHRGSIMASNWLGRIGSSIVRPPRLLASIGAATLSVVTADPTAMRMNRIPNSIDTLAPNNRFVREVNKLPITPGIPYHSIIGDRGRGDTPESSDGVVAYWSSHLEGAQSELIVPSNHSTPRDPQAIAEVERILKLNR